MLWGECTFWPTCFQLYQHLNVMLKPDWSGNCRFYVVFRFFNQPNLKTEDLPSFLLLDVGSHFASKSWKLKFAKIALLNKWRFPRSSSWNITPTSRYWLLKSWSLSLWRATCSCGGSWPKLETLVKVLPLLCSWKARAVLLQGTWVEFKTSYLIATSGQYTGKPWLRCCHFLAHERPELYLWKGPG